MKVFSNFYFYKNELWLDQAADCENVKKLVQLGFDLAII
jgi:hypothetical protein